MDYDKYYINKSNLIFGLGLLLVVIISFFVVQPLIMHAGKVGNNVTVKGTVYEINGDKIIVAYEDKKEGIIRYNIASNSDALFSQAGKSYKRVFELEEDKPDEIRFYINKSFFDQKGGSDFNASLIANEIATRLAGVYKEYTITPNQNKDNYELHIKFNRQLENDEDISTLISLIDYTLLLFIARNKS